MCGRGTLPREIDVDGGLHGRECGRWDRRATQALALSAGKRMEGRGAEISYGAPAASGSVRNMAMASISTSNSGRHRMAWIPVEAGSGSSSCSS